MYSGKKGTSTEIKGYWIINFPSQVFFSVPHCMNRSILRTSTITVLTRSQSWEIVEGAQVAIRHVGYPSARKWAPDGNSSSCYAVIRTLIGAWQNFVMFATRSPILYMRCSPMRKSLASSSVRIPMLSIAQDLCCIAAQCRDCAHRWYSCRGKQTSKRAALETHAMDSEKGSELLASRLN